MDSKKSRWRVVYITLLIVLCLSFVALLSRCVVEAKREAYKFRHRYDNMTVARLQQLTGLSFPPSAMILRHDAWAGLSGEVWVKMSMSRKDADTFIGTLRKTRNAEISSKDDLGISRRDLVSPKWWRSGPPTKFVAASFPGYTWVLVDLDRPDEAIVYVHWAH